MANPAGYMNPINVRTIEQSLNIDSRFRKDYYSTRSTQFSITLPEPQKNVVKMTVASVELPLTYYAVSDKNKNNTYLIIDNEALLELSCKNIHGKAWLLTLPDGNYEPSWMNENGAAAMEMAMNNAIALAVPGKVNEEGYFEKDISGGSTLNPKTDLAYTIDRISGKSIFAVPDGSGGVVVAGQISNLCIRFNVDVKGNLSMNENIQMRLGWLLGYRAAQYISNSSNNAGAIVSEGICYPSGPTYGFLSVNDYQNNTSPVLLQAFSQSTLDNNIITKINLGSEMGGNTVYKSSDAFTLSSAEHSIREYFGPVNIQKLEITLYDEYGRIIDLNNMDMSLTLRFEKLYD